MSMQSLLAANQSMARMQTMQSARTQMQGTANVLRIESQQDGGNEKKDAKVAELEAKSNDLMGDLMDEVTNVNETLKPDEEVKAEEKQAEQRDTVTLSDIAAGHRGTLPEIHPTMGEAIIYDASGSMTVSVSANTAPILEVTV